MIRPLRVDFAERRAWKSVWTGALLIAVAMAGLSATPLRDQLVADAALQSKLKHAQSILIQQPRRAEASTDPATLGIAVLLRQDLGPVLNAAEAHTPDGVRLIGLVLVNPGGGVRLEYHLSSPKQVELVSVVLNGGYDVAPWKLRDLAGFDAGRGQAASASWAAMRGVWETGVAQLQR